MKYKNYYNISFSSGIFLIQKLLLESKTDELLINSKLIAKKKLLLKKIKFFLMIQQRINKEPLSFILNYKYFYDIKLFIAYGIFIPRYDSESIIENIFKLIKNDNIYIVELCTGSGVFSIILMRNIKNLFILIIDINFFALLITQENLILNNLKSNINMKNMNLLYFIKNYIRVNIIDLIISNPPYITTQLLLKTQVDTKVYEPKNSLLGKGKHALLDHKYILKCSINLIKSSGYIVLEIGIEQIKYIFKFFLNSYFYGPFLIYDNTGNIRGVIYQKI